MGGFVLHGEIRRFFSLKQPARVDFLTRAGILSIRVETEPFFLPEKICIGPRAAWDAWYHKMKLRERELLCLPWVKKWAGIGQNHPASGTEIGSNGKQQTKRKTKPF